MRLAESIGAMLAQMAPPTASAGRIRRVTLRTRGGRDVSVVTRQARQLLEVCDPRVVVAFYFIDCVLYICRRCC